MIPYIFYNYTIERNGKALDSIEQEKLILSLVGKDVPYRKKKPTLNDYDTCIATPELKSVDIGDKKKLTILTFRIAKHISERDVKKYDKKANKIVSESQHADEDALGSVIAVPFVGKLAVADKSGEGYLSATSTVSRFRTIIEFNKEYSVTVSTVSSPAELENAIKSWRLTEFSFSARPFNPSVHVQGEKVHALLNDSDGKISGRMTPNKGEELKLGMAGFLWEIIGLAKRGYAKYGARGKSKDGHMMQIEKADPNDTKPPVIRLFADDALSEVERGEAIAKALADVHGDN